MCERAEKLAKREVKPRSECGKCCCCAPHTKHNSQKTFKECLEAFNDLEDLNDDAEQDLELLKMIAGLYTIAGEPMRPRPVRQPACPGRQPASVHGRPPHPLSSLFEPPNQCSDDHHQNQYFLEWDDHQQNHHFDDHHHNHHFLGWHDHHQNLYCLG